jgi:hypothetical protein
LAGGFLMAGVTPRFGLPYPGLDDQPDGPDAAKDLAEAVEAQLSRLKSYPTASRPVGVPAGFAIYDDDLDAPFYWNGSAWLPFGGSGGGGGGGGTSGGAHFEQESAQSIPNTASGPGTIMSLPVGDDGTLIERTAQGAGHKFKLLTSGIWACGASARITSTSQGGEVSCSIRADLAGGTAFETVIAPDGGRREGLPRTLQPGRTRYLPANTMIAVFIFNGTGSTRTIEVNGGEWANLDLWLVG